MEKILATGQGTATSENVSFFEIIFAVIGKGEKYVSVRNQFKSKIEELNETKTI